jgi:ribosomal protein S18 acetylase RimI-like enzyme
MLTFRELRAGDREPLRQLLANISVFNQEDQDLALELIDCALNNPAQKDYQFVLAWEGPDLCGYACYGPTALTDRTYDLYWIAVDDRFAGQGIGSQIMKNVEGILQQANGRMIVIETSSLQTYGSTRAFYLKHGYHLAEQITDFFRSGEDRVTYTKMIGK